MPYGGPGCCRIVLASSPWHFIHPESIDHFACLHLCFTHHTTPAITANVTVAIRLEPYDASRLGSLIY